MPKGPGHLVPVPLKIAVTLGFCANYVGNFTGYTRFFGDAEFQGYFGKIRSKTEDKDTQFRPLTLTKGPLTRYRRLLIF